MDRSHKKFTDSLLKWFDQHGRKHLPWQHPRCAYRIWVSEIMLQQTQVKTVIPYFKRFMEHFPTINALANAPLDSVLALWSGLGYYSRARNLHKTAIIVCKLHDGVFPSDLQALEALPGIGASTAAAIASLGYNRPTAILDGNVKRVLSRYFLIDGQFEKADVKHTYWTIAQACMPNEMCAEYTQAIMDLGALCCTPRSPQCSICPMQSNCLAYAQDKVALYPPKKPKLNLPEKHQLFLILFDKHKIFLEKRPPMGIWGGLWCLPSLELEELPENYVKINHNIIIKKPVDLIKLKHTFSHFRLHMHVKSAQISGTVNSIAEINGKWIDVVDLPSLGLAKPIRKIIDYFYESKSIT